MIDPVTAQKIKDTADIVEVVSDYVHLTRRGANYMGLCPFHNERTPSFSVNKSGNFCYCFSCHKGGSPVNFIMEKEGISYYEALKQLARKYGIEIQEKELTDEERIAQSLREGMFVANDWARDYFIKNLEEKEEGRNIGLTYLYGRHVTPEAVKAFQLGYSIDKGTDFTDAALKKGFSLETLKKLGLVGTSQQGQNYDKFRGRVMFPILNAAGKTVGFGGRDLKGSPAKYINSPESEIYSKSKELYGLFQAKTSMGRDDKCYLVEGYLDVIGFWQSGIKNVVASSGTALTDGQIALIHRFTPNVTLIYDGDAAGIKASIRGIDMLLDHGMNVKSVLLPPGEDPDSLAAKLSPEELKEFLQKNETDIIRFKAKVLLDEAKNDPQKRWEAIRSVVDSLAHIADKIKRDVYIQECSRIFNVPEESLSTEVAKTRISIVEQERVRRRMADLNQNLPQDSDNKTPKAVTSPITNKKDVKNYTGSSLFQLEKNLIETCLKYGFFRIWDDIEETEPGVFQTTFEYIDEELSIDGISLSFPPFIKVFESLRELLPEFKRDLKNYLIALEEELNSFEKNRYKEKEGLSFSMNDILKEEGNIKKEIIQLKDNKIREFSQNYITSRLASHEDEDIRRISLETFAQKHKLSKIFTKNKKPVTNEETVLPIVINSLNVLKNGILDIQLKELMKELKNIEGQSIEQEREIHKKISSIMQLRVRMAKDIGERIVSPRK